MVVLWSKSSAACRAGDDVHVCRGGKRRAQNTYSCVDGEERRTRALSNINQHSGSYGSNLLDSLLWNERLYLYKPPTIRLGRLSFDMGPMYERRGDGRFRE